MRLRVFVVRETEFVVTQQSVQPQVLCAHHRATDSADSHHWTLDASKGCHHPRPTVSVVTHLLRHFLRHHGTLLVIRRATSYRQPHPSVRHPCCLDRQPASVHCPDHDQNTPSEVILIMSYTYRMVQQIIPYPIVNKSYYIVLNLSIRLEFSSD